MRNTILVSSFLTILSGILLVPTNAQADDTVNCILAQSQGSVSPRCAKLLGLGNPDEKQGPADNGGIHLKSTLHYQSAPETIAKDNIVGLSLGMSMADAVNVMKNYCKDDPRITYTFLSMNYKGVSPKTQLYPHILECRLGSDNLRVDISPPVMGSVVTEINRDVFFPADASPRFSELKADIDKKYGVNLLPFTEMKSSSEATLYADASGVITTIPSRSYIRALSEQTYNVPGEIAYLTIAINSVNGNPSNVSNISLKLEDLRAKRDINHEVIKQLKASVDSKLENNNIKPAL
ncbi:unnamed protein product [Commensalibacter communis]|uniref:hypothetical protein n=1 Tax=Commensalibacter communis TaxID=2972786 RepID=UPI0022FF86EA|nr:hypothetical protein [Commensalibacter communis]CAI3947705.1 unnamed protein product [Commensalibacter communis]